MCPRSKSLRPQVSEASAELLARAMCICHRQFYQNQVYVTDYIFITLRVSPGETGTSWLPWALNVCPSCSPFYLHIAYNADLNATKKSTVWEIHRQEVKPMQGGCTVYASHFFFITSGWPATFGNETTEEHGAVFKLLIGSMLESRIGRSSLRFER